MKYRSIDKKVRKGVKGNAKEMGRWGRLEFRKGLNEVFMLNEIIEGKEGEIHMKIPGRKGCSKRK